MYWRSTISVITRIIRGFVLEPGLNNFVSLEKNFFDVHKYLIISVIIRLSKDLCSSPTRPVLHY